MELSALLDDTKVTIKQHNLRLCALEKLAGTKVVSASLGTEGSNIAEHRAGNHGNCGPVRNSDINIERMVKHVLDKEKRKFNVIIFNLADTDSFYDDKRNLCELM